MIGGTDIIVARELGEGSATVILELLRAAWPEALIEDANTDAPPLKLRDAAAVSLPDEFFVYQDDTSQESWARSGATDENADRMIHVIIEPQRVTCVVDGWVTSALAEQMRLAVLKEQFAAQQGMEPFPSIRDAFFDDLDDPSKWIEAA